MQIGQINKLEENMDSQTKVFRAHRALAWFYALLGAAISAVAFSGFLGKMGNSVVLIPLIFAIIFSMHYFTAVACKTGKPGGRLASIVIACFMLFGFPIGTIIGIYLLANTWRTWPPVETSLQKLI
jgi:hypothetical protein